MSDDESAARTIEKVSTLHHVPEDIIFSILSKLSLKSVKRFACVRKSWSLLFENPCFVQMFYKNLISKNHSLYDGASILLNRYQIIFDIESKLHMHLLSGEKFENKVELKWPRYLNKRGYREYHPIDSAILGSAINGVLCVYDIERQWDIVLWDLANEQLTRVPENELFEQYEHRFFNHGFGYDSVRDDYKIIQRVEYVGFDGMEDYDEGVPSDDLIWNIYSLRNNSWRRLHVDMRPGNAYSAGDDAYLNGVCHWLGKQGNGQSYVVSFDLYTEVPVTTLLPSDLNNSRVDQHLTVLNGFVAMITSYVKTGSSSYHISIAILGEPGVDESWTKLFDLGPFSGRIESIGAGMNGDIFLRKDADNELVCLDLTTGAIENIGFKADGLCSQIVIYKEKHTTNLRIE